MKKNTKRIIATVLSVCMLFAFGGCDKDKSSDGTLTQIVLNQSDITLNKGETFSLKVAEAKLSDLTFESSDPSVVTVNASGTLKAVGVGNAVITVKIGKLSSTCSVTVKQETIYSLTLDKSSAKTSVGSEISVTAYPKKAGELLDTVAEWTVERVGEGTAAEIATYTGSDTNTLTFTGVAAGELKVTAKANGCEASLLLTVISDAENVEGVDSDQVRLDEEEIAQRLDDKTTNWANKKYISLWSSVNGTNPAYDVTNDGIAYGYFDCAADDGDSYMYFDGDVLKAAAEKGYTNVTFKASAGAEKPFDFWLRAHGPNGWAENQAVYFAGKAQNEEVTIKLSDLKTNDGEYFLAFKMAGWDQNCLTVFHSLTFSSPIKDALNKGFAQENTNWASAEYVAVWGSVNGSLPTYSAEHGGVAYRFFECAEANDTAYMYFDSTILKAASEKGYTKVIFQAGEGANENYDFWFRAHGPNCWTESGALYFAGKNRNEVVTIDLSKLKTSEGEYFLAFKMAGWSGSFHTVFTSFTFGK